LASPGGTPLSWRSARTAPEEETISCGIAATPRFDGPRVQG
jgi:hypothetical protein